MKPQYINPIHLSHNACLGYPEFLLNKQNGKFFKFSWLFFMFQGFFFVYHKMYKEAICYIMLFSLYFHFIEIFGYGAFIFCVLSTWIFTSFSFYNLYEWHNDKVLKKSKNDIPTFIDKMSNENHFISIIRLFLSWIWGVLLFMFAVLFFNSFGSAPIINKIPPIVF